MYDSFCKCTYAPFGDYKCLKHLKIFKIFGNYFPFITVKLKRESPQIKHAQLNINLQRYTLSVSSYEHLYITEKKVDIKSGYRSYFRIRMCPFDSVIQLIYLIPKY